MDFMPGPLAVVTKYRLTPRREDVNECGNGNHADQAHYPLPQQNLVVHTEHFDDIGWQLKDRNIEQQYRDP